MEIGTKLTLVRERRPLVQNITNFVVMNTTANALLAIGASPVMAHAVEELEDMINLADALVINMGTLDEHWSESMFRAVKIAGEYGKPVVFDPVGAGATRYRTSTAIKLLDTGDVSILRGNYSEIKALSGEKIRTRGVDSSGYGEDAMEIAHRAHELFGVTVALTGKTDYATDGKETYAVDNGTPLLSKVTGTGCMLTAIMGAFASVAAPLEAAVSSLVIFGIAAEKAEREAPYPGSFHIKLYDWLYRMDEEAVERGKRVRRIES